jgi:hypothetical protein
LIQNFVIFVASSFVVKLLVFLGCGSAALGSVSFEELNGPFMILRRLETLECSEIPPFPRFWILLA